MEEIIGQMIGHKTMLGITEEECEEIQDIFRIIDGDKRIGKYTSYGHLEELFERVSARIVTPDRPPMMYAMVVPRIVAFFNMREWSRYKIDEQQLNSILSPLIGKWEGMYGQMRREYKRQRAENNDRSPAEQRAEIISAHHADVEIEADREARKQFAIEERLKELRAKANTITVTKEDADRLIAMQSELKATTGTKKHHRKRKRKQRRKTERALPAKEHRAQMILDYKDECKAYGIKVTDHMIAMAASTTWHDRTQVTWWKSSDPRSTAAADRAIRRVLTQKPHLSIQPKENTAIPQKYRKDGP
jgi:hypothetical protein